MIIDTVILNFLSQLYLFYLQITRHISPYEQQIVMPWLKTFPKRVSVWYNNIRSPCLFLDNTYSYLTKQNFWLFCGSIYTTSPQPINITIWLVKGMGQILWFGTLLCNNCNPCIWNCRMVGCCGWCPGSFLQVLNNCNYWGGFILMWGELQRIR